MESSRSGTNPGRLCAAMGRGTLMLGCSQDLCMLVCVGGVASCLQVEGQAIFSLVTHADKNRKAGHLASGAKIGLMPWQLPAPGRWPGFCANALHSSRLAVM